MSKKNNKMSNMKRLSTIVALSIVLAFNQESSAANELQNNNYCLNFTAKGLQYEVELTDIFIGNFSEVPWKRDEMMFIFLFNSYVSSYSKSCSSYLPKDKIQLLKRVCDQKQITRNGYGQIISENCISYRWEPSGIFASPAMFEAVEELRGFELGAVLEMMDSNDAFGTSAKIMGESKAIALDIPRLIQMNSCDSEGLKRFQENLRRFAMGQDPIRMENAIAERKKTAVLSSNQDVTKLVEDLVAQNSRQWVINRFEHGSVGNAQILSTNTQGAPSKVKATYRYKGWSGTRKGSVVLTFTSKGLPDCLYFSDFPQTCRPANRKIVNAYAKNKYAK